MQNQVQNFDHLIETGFVLHDYLKGIEQAIVYAAIQKANGNKRLAADLLGMKRTTLFMKLKDWSVDGSALQGN